MTLHQPCSCTSCIRRAAYKQCIFCLASHLSFYLLNLLHCFIRLFYQFILLLNIHLLFPISTCITLSVNIAIYVFVVCHISRITSPASLICRISRAARCTEPRSPPLCHTNDYKKDLNTRLHTCMSAYQL